MAHGGVHLAPAHLRHLEHDLAVVEQEQRSLVDVLWQLLVVQAHTLAITDFGGGVEDEVLALLERHLAVLELADADLRALQVAEDGDGAAGLRRELLDERGALFVVGRDAMREIEPHHVDARADHALEHGGFGGGGTEGCYDLRTAHRRANVAEGRRA